MRVFDQMSLRTRFARLRQRHGVSIGVFEQEYEDDEGDGDLYDVTLMTTEHSPTNASGPVVLFSDTEVLLDNQAGRSVFVTRACSMTREDSRGPSASGASKGIRVEAYVSSLAAPRAATSTSAHGRRGRYRYFRGLQARHGSDQR
jgi:hypothetical protein